MLDQDESDHQSCNISFSQEDVFILFRSASLPSPPETGSQLNRHLARTLIHIQIHSIVNRSMPANLVVVAAWQTDIALPDICIRCTNGLSGASPTYVPLYPFNQITCAKKPVSTPNRQLYWTFWGNTNTLQTMSSSSPYSSSHSLRPGNPASHHRVTTIQRWRRWGGGWQSMTTHERGGAIHPSIRTAKTCYQATSFMEPNVGYAGAPSPSPDRQPELLLPLFSGGGGGLILTQHRNWSATRNLWCDFVLSVTSSQCNTADRT